MIIAILIHGLFVTYSYDHMGRKNLEEQEGSPDPMPTMNPTTNHLKNENNGWRHR